MDLSAKVFWADVRNNTIRRSLPDGVVATLARLAGSGGEDGVGSAARCLGFCPMAVASGGVLYVVDGKSSTIGKGMPAGSVPALVLQQPVLRVAPVAFSVASLPGLPVDQKAARPGFRPASLP